MLAVQHALRLALVGLVVWMPLVVVLWLDQRTARAEDEAVAEGEAAAVRGAINVTIDYSRPDGTSQLAVGVTHTREGLGVTGHPTAIERGRALLAPAVHWHNRHIYGFGARNPNPWPGVYDWRDLDALVASSRSLNAKLVLTICCAPDWMTANPTPTSNGEPHFDQAPLPQHYDAMAELARQVARRYPDVRHYIVWNEAKGFAFPYHDYTTLYNRVYDALKEVDPTLQVGGFYISMVADGRNPLAPIDGWEMELFDYWNANKHGADFIGLDHSAVRWNERRALPQSELMARLVRFQGITQQIRARSNLPIWWVESYIDPYTVSGEHGAHPDDFQAAGLASILYYQLKGGAAVSLRWGPVGNAYYATRGWNPNVESLMTDVIRPDGGLPTPNYAVYRNFHELFAPGTTLVRATSSDPRLLVLASANTTLLINQYDRVVTVQVNGQLQRLDAYAVQWLATRPAVVAPNRLSQPN